MAAAAPLPKLTIIKATYSKTSGNDVTQKLRDIVAKNGGNLIMDAKTDFNQVFGDPEPRVDKLFHVVYSYGPHGAQKSMTHAEKHVDIYLPALEIKQGQVLTVNVVKAVGLRDTRTIGKQNPYAKLTTGSESFKTKSHEKGGTDPVWNQSFIFNLDGKDQFMHVVVYDKETISDDTIARFDIPLATLAAATGEVAYNLVHPNDFKKSAGAIVLSCEFRDPNAPVIPAAAAAPAQPAPAVVQQPQVVYQQPQPQVVYMQPQQPQVIYQQPQVVYQQPQPQVVYQQPQPQVVYQQPVVQPAPQVVYQAPVVQQPQHKQPEPAPVAAAPSMPWMTLVWPGVPAGNNDPSEFDKCKHQRWKYDGSYITGFDGRVLDINGGSRDAGAAVIAWPKKAGGGSDVLNQQWDYKDGMFVTRMGTGFVITTDSTPGNGSKVTMQPQNWQECQKWDIDKFGFIVSRAGSKNQSLTYEWPVKSANEAQGMNTWNVHPPIKYDVIVWPGVPAGNNDPSEFDKCKHQRWKYDGSYLTAFDGRVLDINGGSRDAGAAVIAWPKKAGGGSDVLNQQWDYKDGMFVTRMGTGFVITTDSTPGNGSKVTMQPQNWQESQKWDIDRYGFVVSRAGSKNQSLTYEWPIQPMDKLQGMNTWNVHPPIKY